VLQIDSRECINHSTLTIHPLHTHYPPTPHSLSTHSTLTIHPLHTHYPPTPHSLSTHSTLTIHPLHTHYPPTPHSLSTHSILTIHPLHTHYPPTPHSLSTHSTLTIHPLHTHYPPTHCPCHSSRSPSQCTAPVWRRSPGSVSWSMSIRVCGPGTCARTVHIHRPTPRACPGGLDPTDV
jgi:hypothetical protein